MREWNADVYHRVSDPQVGWGTAVLERLPLAGDELVIDVGCGTGRLTEGLLQRLPRGRAVAVDVSANMLATAREHLAPRFHERVAFAQADAAALPFVNRVDAIFSTATFHWIADHARLFASLFSALAPRGLLVAQCGGGPNIRRVTDRCAVLMQQPPFEAFFAGWSDGWEFADAETTHRRLEAAGFDEIETSLEAAPITKPDAQAYREFVAHVVCRRHLARLPDDALCERFMDGLTQQAAHDTPPFELDYWRLNLRARKHDAILRW